MRKRIWFGCLLLSCLGYADPLPKVADSEKVKPKRFTIPESRSDRTLPRTMMEIPSVVETEPASPEARPIEVKNKNNRVVDNVLFGFLTLDGKPLKDEEIKRKARIAVADLWFGKNPGNCWIDEKKVLYVEGSPLRMVFVYQEKGKRRDFEVEEEDSISEQFAQQVRAILYAPARRSLACKADNLLYFGVLKDGKPFGDLNEEYDVQQKIYRLLSGNDVKEFEITNEGDLRWNKSRITLSYFYVDSNSENSEVISFDEPSKTIWHLKQQQHLRQILVVERQAEMKRVEQLAAFTKRVTDVELLAAPLNEPPRDKEARKKALKDALGQISDMEKTLVSLARESEREELDGRLVKAKSQAESELETLLYPIPIAISEKCPRYQLAQVKRQEWRLQYLEEKNTEGKEQVFSELPLWQKCDGDTLILARDGVWDVYHKGERVFSREADLTAISSVSFKKEKDSPVVRIAYDKSKFIVGEYRVAENTYRLRLLLGDNLDEVYTAYLDENGDLDLGTLGKFVGVDYEQIIASPDGFLFSARSQRKNDNGKNLFLVSGNKVSEFPDTFHSKKPKTLTWDDKNHFYRAVFEEDEAYFYEFKGPEVQVTKRLKVSDACEKHYGFKVEDSGLIAVDLKGGDVKAGLEISGLRSVVCSAKALLILATDVKGREGVVPNGESAPAGPTLFVLSEDRTLSAVHAPREFSFTTLEVDQSQLVAKFGGPTTAAFSFDESGNIIAPVSRGNPNEDVGMWYWPNGKTILWNKGVWQAIFEKTAAIDSRDRFHAVIGSGLKLKEGKDESSDNTLFTFDGDRLVGTYSALLGKEGEVAEKVALVKVDDQWAQRVWLKNNTDYTLLVSLDGKSVTPKRFIPFERLER